jgi:hypothetical protein
MVLKAERCVGDALVVDRDDSSADVTELVV